MKNYRSFLAVAALGMASAASAQNLNSGYFTEGYLYRHDLNPAFANEQNYIAMLGAQFEAEDITITMDEDGTPIFHVLDRGERRKSINLTSYKITK